MVRAGLPGKFTQAPFSRPAVSKQSFSLLFLRAFPPVIPDHALPLSDFQPLPPPGCPLSDPNLSSFIWSLADLLRGDYKQSDYGKVIRPFRSEIDAELKGVTDRILTMIAGLSK